MPTPTPRPMRRLTVVATLDAPVVLTDELHLDGLLAAAHPRCRQQHLTRGTPVADLIDPPLPVMQVHLRQAVVRLCTAAQTADGPRVLVDHAVKRRDAEDIESLARPINLSLGPGKNRMRKLPVVVTPTLTWHAIGDRRGVIRLLQRLTHVGSERAAGYGFVRRWTVTEAETDAPETVLVADGVAQRHLPVSWCEWAQSEATGPLRAPYWHPARQGERIVPAGTRCVLHDAVRLACHESAQIEQQRAHRQRHRQRSAEAAARAAARGEPLSRRQQRFLEWAARSSAEARDASA